MLKTILFDLDGTLLPMVEKEFLEGYFGLLTKTMEPRGLSGKELIAVLWRGVAAMMAENGRTRPFFARSLRARIPTATSTGTFLPSRPFTARPLTARASFADPIRRLERRFGN